MTTRANVSTWLRTYWPELLLLGALLFLCFRQLGTFPDAWEDDSLFMIIARNVAEGRGYVLPVLRDQWAYPYILGVGPTIIEPSALFINLFGFSVAIARMPMVLWLLLTTLAAYAYAARIGGRAAARWSTALLISFSAFINTGKPVLGEIPAFFFLIGGLLTLDEGRDSWTWTILAGLCFGLAVVTKLTFGLVYPALALAWLVVLACRDWRELGRLTVIGLIAGLTFLVASPVLGYWDPGFIGELTQYGLAEGGSETLMVLRTQPELLLRFQYLYFGGMLLLGSIGLWAMRFRMSRTHTVTLATLIALFILFFLNSRGWYRHLLPAHLLLLPFVPIGAALLLRARFLTVALLSFFVLAQSWWQLTYKGSRLSPEAADAAAALEQQFPDRDILIAQPEIFVRVMQNPHRFFLSNEFEMRTYARFAALPIKQEQHCLPILRKFSPEEAAAQERLTPVHQRYMLVEPPTSCNDQ